VPTSSYTPQVGDYVRILVDFPDDVPVSMLYRVIVVNDPDEVPGKVVGLECEERWPMLHECDGACAPMKGWWARPESLEPVEL
jgi:hypothetical protein